MVFAGNFFWLEIALFNGYDFVSSRVTDAISLNKRKMQAVIEPSNQIQLYE